MLPLPPAFKRRSQRRDRNSVYDASNRLEAVRFNVERSASCKGQQIASVVRSAQEKINDANSTIRQLEKVTDPWDKSRDVVATVLSPLHDVAKIVNAFADAHPAAKVLANAFTTIIGLELTRRENDLRIAIIFYEMSLCLLVLADLDEVYNGRNPPASDWTEAFGLSLEGIVETIRRFSGFCDIYYNRSVLVKLCRANDYKEKIALYLSEFDRHKRDLQLTINVHASAKAAVIDVKVDDLAINVNEIKTLLQRKSERELSIDAYLASNGGLDDVLQNEEKLRELSNYLGEKLSTTIRATLSEDIDRSLSTHMKTFTWDLWSRFTSQLLETFVADVRSSQPQEGPHELIQDSDIRAVWKKMQAGTSVETKMFLNALKEHFYLAAVTYRAQHGEKSPDHWALLFLSKMILYPAVGDALDEDLSGFISLDEVNTFLITRPPQLRCNALQWIAFWGFGPYKTNVEFVQEIGEMVDEIQQIRVRPENALRVRYFRCITQRLRMISVHTDIVDYLGETDIVNSTYDGFEKVRENWAALELKRIEDNLKLVSYTLPGAEAIALVLGNRRLEHYIIFLIYALLHRHLQIIKLAETDIITVQEFLDMRASWECLFNVFDNRLNLLLKIWRQHRLDLTSHVETYAGGLFENWYHFRSAMTESPVLASDGCREEVEDTPVFREKRRRRLATLGIGSYPSMDIAFPRRRSIVDEPRDTSILNYGPLDNKDDDSALVIDEELVWERIVVTERKEKVEIKRKLDAVERMLAAVVSHFGVELEDVSEQQADSHYPSRSATLRPSAFRPHARTTSQATGAVSPILSELEALSQSPENSRPSSPISINSKSGTPLRQPTVPSKPGSYVTLMQPKGQCSPLTQDFTQAALEEKVKQPSKRDTLLAQREEFCLPSPPISRTISDSKVPQDLAKQPVINTSCTPAPRPPPLPPRPTHKMSTNAQTEQLASESGNSVPHVYVASPTEIPPNSHFTPSSPYPPQSPYAHSPPVSPPSNVYPHASGHHVNYATPHGPFATSTHPVPYIRPPTHGRTPSNTLNPQATDTMFRPPSPGRSVTFPVPELPNSQPPSGYTTPVSGNGYPYGLYPAAPGQQGPWHF